MQSIQTTTPYFKPLSQQVPLSTEWKQTHRHQLIDDSTLIEKIDEQTDAQVNEEVDELHNITSAPAKQVEDSGRVTNKMLLAVADKFTVKIVQKLFAALIDLQEFNNAREELLAIYHGNASWRHKLEEIITVLERLGGELRAKPNQNLGMHGRLSAYLDAITPWLKSVSTQWKTLALTLDEMQNTPDVLGKVVALMDTTQALLLAPELNTILDSTQRENIDYGLRAVRQTLSQIQLWQALPNGAGFADYLGILSSNPLVGGLVSESMQKLCQALASALKGTRPSEDSLPSQLTWLGAILSNDKLRREAQPHLEMILGETQTHHLFSLFQMIKQLRDCPTDVSLAGQALWLLSTFSQRGDDSAAMAWGRQFLATLGADPDTTMLLKQLLNLEPSQQSWTAFSYNLLSRTVTQGTAQWALSWAARRMLPDNVVMELDTFYRQCSATESWGSFLTRMTTGLCNVATPFVVGAAMGHPLAAVTMQYAESLQRCTSLEDMLTWFATHDQSENKTIQMIHSQYLNAMVLWQVRQAFTSGDTAEAEAALSNLARQLKDVDVVKHFPQLEKLIDLIPLLPALREASKTIDVPFSGDSLLAWSEQWITALAKSDSPYLHSLRDQLSRHVVNWVADAVVSACNKPCGMLPGTAAQPEGEVPVQNGNLVDEDQMDTASSPGISWPLMAGGISLEAIGLGVMAYAFLDWQKQAKAMTGTTSTDYRQLSVVNPHADDATEACIEVDDLAAPPDRKPLWVQKFPWLLGIAGLSMVAGGVAIYKSLPGEPIEQSQISEEDHQEELNLIAALDVPDLDLFFEIGDDAVNDNRNENGDSAAIRVRRDLSSQQNIPIEEISLRISTVIGGVKNSRLNREFVALWQRAGESSDVSRYRGDPGRERIAALIKTIQLFTAFLDENARRGLTDASYQSGQRVLKKLWTIVDNLQHDPDIGSAATVAAFRQRFSPAIPKGSINLAADAAWNEIDFTQYDDAITTDLRDNFERVLASTTHYASSQEAKHAYLMEFHQRLQQMIQNELRLLDAPRGTIVNSQRENNRIALILTATAIAQEVIAKIPNTDQTASYLSALLPPDQRIAKLQQAFELQDTDAIRTAYARYNSAAETRLFQSRIDASFNPNEVTSLDGLPSVFVNAYKRRIQELGREIYSLLAKNRPTSADLARVQELQCTKFHLSKLLADEMQNQHILKELKTYGSLNGKYSGDQAVFEAKKIAVKLFFNAFSGSTPVLDDEAKIATYAMIVGHADLSDEAKSYLIRAGALVRFMMIDNQPQRQYVRITPEMTKNFIDTSTRTEYVRRLYNTPPTTYRELDTFQRSGEKATREEYYAQFIDYKQNSLGFDAKTIAYTTLLSCGLTDYQISQMKPKRVIYCPLEVTKKLVLPKRPIPVKGPQPTPIELVKTQNIMAFVVMENGEVMATSDMTNGTHAKFFKKEEVAARPFLQRLVNPILGEQISLEGDEVFNTILNPIFGITRQNLNEVPPGSSAIRVDNVQMRIIASHAKPTAGKETIDVMEMIVKDNLTDFVALLKEAYKDRGFWDYVLTFVPFFDQIRDSIADPEHKLDVNSIIFDAVSIIACVLPAIGSFAKLGTVAQQGLKNALMAGIRQQLTGKALANFVFRTMANDPALAQVAFKSAAYTAYVGMDIVAPLPLDLLKNAGKGIWKLFHEPLPQGRALDDLVRLADQEVTALSKTTSIQLPGNQSLSVRSSQIMPELLPAEMQSLSRPLSNKPLITRRVGLDPCPTRVRRSPTEGALAACSPPSPSSPTGNSDVQRIQTSGDALKTKLKKNSGRRDAREAASLVGTVMTGGMTLSNQANRVAQQLDEALRLLDRGEFSQLKTLLSGEVTRLQSASTAKTTFPGVSVNNVHLRELIRTETRLIPDNVVATAERNGRIVYLVKGDGAGGLDHIMQAHEQDFISMGYAKEKIPSAVMDALTRGTLVGYQGADAGRPVYRVDIDNQTRYIAVSVGNTGYVIGANPTTPSRFRPLPP